MMMAKFVLVVVLYSFSSNPAVLSVPFATSEACESARSNILRDMSGIYVWHAQCHWTGL